MAAGFSVRFSREQGSSMEAAPARRAAISMPPIAAEKRPTGESTLKRPPTPSGTGRVA